MIYLQLISIVIIIYFTILPINNKKNDSNDQDLINLHLILNM